MKSSSSLSFDPAPAGSKVRFTLLLTVVSLVVADAFVVAMALRQSGKDLFIVVAGGLVVSLFVAGIWFCARILSYDIEGQELVVRRRLLTNRFSLNGLVSIERQPTVLKGARKKIGNDGLGAISGSFSSKEHGALRVFLSDPEKAVLLKLADGRAVVVSPEHPGPFIESVKRRAD